MADFAKLVEAFDAKSISFVAITQQFNTTISTGRLTLNILLSFAQFERELSSERVRDKIAASLAKGKWTGGNIPFGYELENSRKLIDDWLTDPTAHAAELGSVAHTLRDTVILGYQSGKEEDNRLRRNALRVASELVNASAATIQRYVSQDPATRTDKDHEAAREAARLLDNVGNQLYFSSGAFQANEKPEPTGLSIIEIKKSFLDDAENILRRIGDVATPHTTYHLIDLLVFLRAADPAKIFDLAAHALLNGGKMHGYQFESMGANRFVEMVGIFLADHRDIFVDQKRREVLIAYLDAFVEAGWPKARRLLYHLPELL